MLGVIISAVAIIMLGYLCVGLAGYLAFPTTVASNVLLSFSQEDWLMQARLAPTAWRSSLLCLALLRLCTQSVHLLTREVRRGEAQATLSGGARSRRGGCRLYFCWARV